MEAISLLYIPCSSADEAKKLAIHLLNKRQIACANILPQMTSIYPWQGKITEATEALLLVKTKASMIDEVRLLISNEHSYETPCIAEIKLDSLNQKYGSWLLTNLL